jgi:hypothetical protein
VFLLTPIHVSATIPNLVLRTDSFAIAVWSWMSQKRWASVSVWDIGQVPVRNFDWLPFNPPLVAFSGPLIGIRASFITSWL